VADLLTRQSLSLSAANRVFTSRKIVVDALTAQITLRLRRPTTLIPLAWGVTGQLRATLVFAVDGKEYRSSTIFSGGVVPGPSGGEASECVLSYTPPHGFLGRTDKTRRLGELATTSIEAWIILERVAGRIETEIIECNTVDAPAKTEELHRSVTFDAASSSSAFPVGTTLTWSHTTTANADRGMIVGTASQDFGSSSITVSGVTYAGDAMTAPGAQTVVVATQTFCRLWRLSSSTTPATGANDVVVTFTDTGPYTVCGAVTGYGVDTAAPVGTLATGTGSSTTPSIAVSGATGDLVVDVLAVHDDNAMTVGADQTERWNIRSAGNFSGAGSTEPGAASVTMSWTLVNTRSWGMQGIALKAAAGGSANFNATGDLDAQAATIAGSALHGRVSTGALSAQAAAIAGTAHRGLKSAGSLAVQAAAVAGTAHVGRASAGALQAGTVTIEGEASVSRAAIGTLAAGVFLISGLARVNRVATGALEAADATISGDGEASGNPVSEPAAGLHPLSNLLRLHSF